MIGYFDIISFAIAFAVNLLMFGLVAAIGTAITFRLTETASSPRIRYLIAVGIFLLAAVAPLFLTIINAREKNSILQSSSELIEMEKPDDDFQKERDTTESMIMSQKEVPSIAEKKSFSAISVTLDDFVFDAGQSRSAQFFLILWLAVSAGLLFREFIGHTKLRNLRKKLRSADALRRELICPDEIKLYVGEFENPCTIGLLRPVVILPNRFPFDISVESARRILRHEIAHARWRDPLVNAFLRIIRASFWISPGLWFIERLIRIEREAAADRDALLTDSADAAEAEYADSLVKFAGFSAQVSKPNRFSTNAAMHFGNSSALESRVRRAWHH
jgi:beta-lactamase regulating signal transducer with metallopeptidase domain